MRRFNMLGLAICLPVQLIAEELVPPADAPIIPAVLPDLGEIPKIDFNEDPWDLVDQPTVDPTLLKKNRWALPPAETLLPPKALLPAKKIYHKIRIEGNRVFSDGELMQLNPGLLERPIGIDERSGFQDLITKYYISHGYINSGALVPEPEVGSDDLVVLVTEGRLTRVILDRTSGNVDIPYIPENCYTCILTGQRNLRASYLTARVLGNPNQPFEFGSLQKRLQILQMNPNIKRLQAELKPGLLPGEAEVELVIEEIPPWSYGIDIHNQLPPSVGAEQVDLWAENRNLTGFSDALAMRYGVFSGGVNETEPAGLADLQINYSIPVFRNDTSIEGFYLKQGYAIIEEPFTDLDITGSTWTAGGGLKSPIFRDLRDNAWWGLSLGKQHSETELLGEPFSVSSGYVDGELDLTLLRGSVNWIRRNEKDVITVNGELLAGLNALGATDSPDQADSSFLIFRTNLSYLRRMNHQGHLLAMRGAAQWADDALPSPEQWTLGGLSSIRGYRENELVRDSGAWAGVEYRIPIITGDRGELNLISFLDGGFGADHNGDNFESLCSVGIGITGTYRNWLRGQLYWGIPLSARENRGNNIQDYGISFRLSAGCF